MAHRMSGSSSRSYSSSRMSMSSSNFSRASTSSRSFRTSRTSQIRGRESRVAERVRNSIRRISTALFEAPKDKNKLLGTLDESIEDSPWSQNRWRPPAWESSERRTLAEVLTQVPNYIIDKGDDGCREVVSYVDGVVMFTDLSGFTALCEKYAESDEKPHTNGEKIPSRGVDALTASLNDYLGRIVQDLMCANGDILKFAGDAILTLWQCEESEFPATIDRVVTAAINIQCKMDNYMTEVGVNLRVKIGIAVGCVIFYHIANDNERHFGEAGQTIEEVNIAQSSASSGTVVISPKAWDLLEQKLFSYNILENGYVEINRRSSLSKTLQTFMETRDPTKTEIFNNTPEPECLRLTQLSKVSEKDETVYRMYTNQNVISKLDACAELRWLSEIRTVTVMFLEVHLSDYNPENHIDILNTIQLAFTIIYDQMTRMLGTINKLYMFDKGCTFLIIFGMPGKKHEDEPTRALKAADNIMKDFHTKNLEASIGITTGRAFCGIIGHPQRHEYGVIGKSVNLAARLMSNYPKRIACDDTTRTLSNLDPQDFLKLSYIKMKGVPSNNVHYEYKIDRRKDRLFSTFIPPQQIEDDGGKIIGRVEEMKIFEQELARLIEQPKEDPPVSGSDTVKSIVMKIESATGMGKTRLLQEMKNVAEKKKVRVIFAAAGAVEHATPHFAIKALLVQMFRLMECCSATDRADVIIKFVEEDMIKEIYLLNELLKIHVGYVKRAREKDKKKKLTNMICYLFEKAAKEQHTMIILDDAQWIDKDSWIMLHEIIKRCRALIVCSTRPFPAAHPPMEEAKRILNGPFTKEIHLSSLKPDDMVMLACQLIKVTRLPIQLINILRTRSHGVPLYAEQLVSTMLQFKVLQVHTEKQRHDMNRTGPLVTGPLVTDTIQEIPADSSQTGSVTRQRYFSLATPRPRPHHKISAGSVKRMSLMTGSSNELMNRAHPKCAKDSADAKTETIKYYHSIPEIQASTEKLSCSLHAGADLSTVPIKDSVTGVILTRIDQLSPINQMVLKSASVLGRKFHYETLQAITPNIREASLEKALTELLAAKIIERCQEDRLSVAFFRNRRQDSLPQLRGQKMSYTFTHSILQETTYGILCADQRRVLHEGAAEHLQLRFHKCGECGCGKFLQNPLGPRNPSSGVAFIGASHGLSLLGRSQLETFESGGDNSEPAVSDDEDELICDMTHSNSDRTSAGNSNNKRVTIGKTTEMEFPFNGRRTTLLGKPNFAELVPPHRACRPSLASVKLEAKFQSTKCEDNFKTLINYKKNLETSDTTGNKYSETDTRQPDDYNSDQDSGTGSGMCSDDEADRADKLNTRRSTSESNVFSKSSSSPESEMLAAPSQDSDIDTMNSYRTNMDQIEDWVLNKDRCHCRVVIRELVPSIVRHWKAAENFDNLISVMIEAVAAAVYMGDSEEAFYWIGEINRRQDDKNTVSFQVSMTRMQEATVRYLQGQAHFKNSQINDAIDCYRKCLKQLGAPQPSSKIEAHLNLTLYVMKHMLDEKFHFKVNNSTFNYEDAERFHIIIQCLGRLRVALEVQHKNVLAYSAAVEQYRYWCSSAIEETSMKLETLANFIHAAQKYALRVPYNQIEDKLNASMEFEALSPDNSMALFYAYLLLTETKISEGGINAGVEHGSNALLLSDSMKHRLLFVSASPSLVLGFFFSNDRNKLVETLKNMNRFAVEISDHEGQAWFVAFALFLETELYEQLESSLMYREYIFSSVSSADFTNDSIARFCMLISLALSFARQGNGQRATSWVTVARTLAPPVISSLTCAFFHALLLETLILLYQMGYDVKRRLHSTLKVCLKNMSVYNCLRPRVYTYLAFVKLLRGRTRDAHTAIARAMHFAELYDQTLDIVRIKHCKRAWFGEKKPKNLLNKMLQPGKRALSSKKVHTLLEDQVEVGEEEETSKVYTLPLHLNNANLSEEAPSNPKISSSSQESKGKQNSSTQEFTDIQNPLGGVGMGTIAECEELILPDTDSSINLILTSCA